MSKLKSLEEFKAFQQEAAEKLAKQTNKVLVCSGTGSLNRLTQNLHLI